MPKGILFMRLFLSKFTFPEAFMRYFNNFDAFMKLVLSMKDGFGNTLMIFFFIRFLLRLSGNCEWP